MQLPENIQMLRCSHWSGDETAADRLHLLLDADLAVIARRALRSTSANSRLTRELRLTNRAVESTSATEVAQRVATVGRSVCDRLLRKPFEAASRGLRLETLHPKLGATQFS
ncbi:MAG: hypothetical protein EXS05_16200 [Planctomycetaceae bacterium]|nr:hypothetical protein [Planctomycetaceae bacterium]